MFWKKAIPKNIAKLTGERLCRSLFFNEIVGLAFFPKMFDSVLSPTGIYLFKVSNRGTRTMQEICSKLTIKRKERRH